MEKSRLFLVFETLTNQELRELEKFVKSPFFNQQKDVVRFLDFLVECQLQLKIIPTKEKAFSYIFPHQEYSDVKVRLLMSDLFKLVEKYLIVKKSIADEVQNKLQLAITYRQRNLPKHFHKSIRAAEELLDKRAYRNAEFLNAKYENLLELYQFASSSKRSGDFNLQTTSDTLDNTFIALKLRQICLLISHQTIYKKEYDFGLLPQILSHIEEKNLLDIPAISIYYYCFHSLTQPQEEHFFKKFKTQIFEQGAFFPKKEIRELYLFALNYCIRRLNEGLLQFSKEGLDLYQQGLKTEILLENKMLSRFTFNNVVAMAIRVNEIEWATTFIHEYKEVLNKKYRESTFSFNRARLEYERKNYNEVIQLLQKSEYRDLLNNLIAKTILLKTYFELEEFNLLDSHLDSMKAFVRRKKIIGYHQANYRNIIHYTKKLLTTNLFDKEKKQQLREQIEQEKILSERDWLLHQL